MVERYVREYASAKMKETESNKLMNSGIKKEILRRCRAAVGLRDEGIITADEAVWLIHGRPDEDMSQYVE